MTRNWRWVLSVALLLRSTTASTAEIHVLSAGAVQEAETALAAEFEHSTGDHVSCVFGTVDAIQDRLKAGERADVVVLSVSAIDAMAKAGALIGNGGTPLAKVGIGVAVRDGAPKPDISTPGGVPRRIAQGAGSSIRTSRARLP